MQVYRKDYFNGESDGVSETYDLRDPNERKGGIRVIISMFVPLILLGGAGAWFLIAKSALVPSIILFFIAVMSAMIGTCLAVVKNKEEAIGDGSDEEIMKIRGVLSIVIIIACCMTYIPFLPYIFAKIFAKKYPDISFYGPGMNAQKFTMVWSLMSLFTVGLIGFLYYVGAFN